VRALTIGVALLTATALFADDKDKDKDKAEWQKVTAKGTKIEVQFPGKPKEEERKAEVEYGLSVNEGKASLTFVVSDLPKKFDLDSKAAVKATLEALRDGTVKGLSGKLAADKEVKLGKYPGRAFDVDTDVGKYRARVYLTPTKTVFVFVLGPKEYVEGEEVKKFLDSLKIGE
jgi:hypothetical protein